MLIRKFIITFILCVASSHVFARWALPADANIEVQASNMLINVHADGTAEYNIEYKIKLLNESGRNAYSTFPLHYNFDNSVLEIIEAKTIVDGHEYILDKALMEDKPLASAVSGFDQKHQVLLAFPNTKVGAILTLKYKLAITKIDMPKFFEDSFSFGDAYTLSRSIKIKSALPLYSQVNDPEKYLLIKQDKVANSYMLDISLKRPVYISIVDEKNGYFNPNKQPWVAVVTDKDWRKFSLALADRYNKVLQQPLPELYKQIADTAKAETDVIKKINLVMSNLNEAVQYMGDWQTSQGRLTAQDLAQVASKRLGDCKDFATGTVAILRSLGIKANVALVLRGEGIYDHSNIKLPGFAHYNHAMVKVELSDRILWIDPTNFFSIADRILADIADREVLVMDPIAPKREHIPNSKPSDFMDLKKQEINVIAEDKLRITGEVQQLGLAAKNFTGAELQVSKQTIHNKILYKHGSFDDISESSVTSPELISRIVTDLVFKFEFTEKNTILKTNAGQALTFGQSIAGNYIFNDEQVSDVFLGSPRIIRSIAVLNNITAAAEHPLDYSLQSPWIDAKRTVKYAKNSVTVEHEYTIKKSWIDNATIKSTAYQNVADQLAKHFKEGVGIVFSR